MKEKFEYIYDEATGIMYKNYFGEIALEDITSSWDYALEKNIIRPGMRRFVVDYRKATLNVSLSEYQKIAEYFKDNINVFRDVRIAVVTEVPRDMVIPTLVERLDEGYLSRPFADMHTAVAWVIGG